LDIPAAIPEKRFIRQNANYMKKDIAGRKDVEILVREFYEKVKKDEVIGDIFIKKAKVDWEIHLPRMYDFWENTLFYTGVYSGNIIQSHTRLNQQFPIEPQHFKRWVQLFTGTVDELFEGEKAHLAKQRAISIATVREIKLRGDEMKFIH
jgi:hemoglobin